MHRPTDIRSFWFSRRAAINATLYDRLNFNFIRDITSVAGIMRVPNVMEVSLLARLHQLDAIFTIFGASDRDKRLILQGRGLRKRL